ncbi:hypothetical protein [Clostridium lacusfryxellense]|uniref:hypothetical protein n=1 Tax=Clostridium lacusfryxellense TaxID=205328 RepID=UPI001C0DBE10|nr:hypothetical protein [Clostridium lacusfryxellense]MBU3114411.1 hypothetical protein [Clostridium lacusfryxellense]
MAKDNVPINNGVRLMLSETPNDERLSDSNFLENNKNSFGTGHVVIIKKSLSLIVQSKGHLNCLYFSILRKKTALPCSSNHAHKYCSIYQIIKEV